MLFASLEREHKGALVSGVLSHAYDATRHFTDELLSAAHITHVRTTELHGDTQTLTIAHSDVGTPLTRRLQHSEIGGNTINDEERLLLMTSLGKTCEVFHDAKHVGLLYDDTSHTAFAQLCLHIVETGDTIPERQNLQFDALMEGVSLEYLEGQGINTACH